jgi:maltose/moltooligosaccharide transporter
MNTSKKPSLSFWQIWNMSFGFLGIQYGFGLQQANMSHIYSYLGADADKLPFLWLAGPLTGLIVQPIIGAMSDKTWTRFGRRRPFFLIGAILGSLAILAMPYSPVLWVAAGLLWILDASMNAAMEPYRAFIGDKLNSEQRTLGFSVQAFMIAGGQVLANMMPFVLAFLGVATIAASGVVPDFVKYSFVIGVAVMMITVIWTFSTTDEYPPDNLEEFRKMQASQGGFFGKIIHAFKEIWDAVVEMPKELRQLWWVKLFTWYGMPLMWQYLSLSIAWHCFNAKSEANPDFGKGAEYGGLALTMMNVSCVVMSFVFPSIIRKIGTRKTYALGLTLGGIGFISMLFTTNVYYVIALMLLVGVAWAAIITVPFIIATSVVPASRIGVYMGLLNAFICIPQFIGMMTVPFFYKTILANDPRNALVLLGICLILGAVACFFISKSIDFPGKTNEEFLEAEVTGAELSEP